MRFVGKSGNPAASKISHGVSLAGSSVNGANQSLARSKTIQAFHIPNDISPPFHISAIVPGVVVDKVKKPIAFAKAPSPATARRLARCRPGGRRGPDPVPPIRNRAARRPASSGSS